MSGRKGRRPGSGRRIPRVSRGTRRKVGWRKRIGWLMTAVGGVLFLMGNIGARTGTVLLPFDRHHVFEQFGGAVLAIAGLAWVTARS